ncbi:uncharacterized protein LOC134671077 [Cydia fagiglandana]|uniref:uncharacterized protein LOC134671077 n=1 Tax=Cydia fagiglandana TaxID=1458189 RepID=UPI002FEE2884
MVYGESLRLPGEMLVSAPDESRLDDPADFVVQLRRKMSSIRPAPVSRHSTRPIFISKNLPTATHVFLRDDTVRRPLQPPYTGPFAVVRRSTDGKTLTLDIKNKEVVVSVDRVKPAFVDSDETHSSGTPAPAALQPQDVPQAQPAEPAPPITIPADTTSNSRPYTTRSGRNVRFKDSDEYCYF